MTKIRAIDGSSAQRAPRPTRRGLTCAIYDTVEALGGASSQQIKKYLPAAIDDIKGFVNKKKLDRAMYNCVYQGYLIHNPKNDHYYIAPIDYFQERRKWLKECELRSRKGVKKFRKKPRPETHSPVFFIPLAGRILIGFCLLLAFVVGVLVGKIL